MVTICKKPFSLLLLLILVNVLLHEWFKEVVEKYLDCGNPKCGFARIRCGDCGSERLLTFSCKVRRSFPSTNH